MERPVEQRLMRKIRGSNFPGKSDLLSWLHEHPHIRIVTAGVPSKSVETASDSRRTWEIRLRSVLKAGASSGHMQAAVDALRQLEQETPNVPVAVGYAEDENRTWIVLFANDDPLCAFWVEKVRSAGR